MDDKRVEVFCDGATTVPEGKQRYKGRCHGFLINMRCFKIHLTKRRSSLVGKLVDTSSYCPGDRAFVSSVTLVGIEICTRPFREAIDISLFTASTELSWMTSDQLVSVRHPDNTDLSCRGMHRSTPLLDGHGHNDTGRSQPKP